MVSPVVDGRTAKSWCNILSGLSDLLHRVAVAEALVSCYDGAASSTVNGAPERGQRLFETIVPSVASKTSRAHDKVDNMVLVPKTVGRKRDAKTRNGALPRTVSCDS
jgi:hypothetical protein